MMIQLRQYKLKHNKQMLLSQASNYSTMTSMSFQFFLLRPCNKSLLFYDIYKVSIIIKQMHVLEKRKCVFIYEFYDFHCGEIAA